MHGQLLLRVRRVEALVALLQSLLLVHPPNPRHPLEPSILDAYAAHMRSADPSTALGMTSKRVIPSERSESRNLHRPPRKPRR